MVIDAEVVLQPRDFASDEFAAHTAPKVWNAGEETTVIWTAGPVEEDAPDTTVVGKSGTPAP